MPNKRDHIVYDLKDGNRILYRGITNDPERREREHKRDGKKFTHMKAISRRMTEEGAKAKEAEKLKTYRRGHKGKNPKYNKSCDG